ncbi:hypothetical protein CAPTEDRAFT_216084, partial [Capitella teleta]
MSMSTNATEYFTEAPAIAVKRYFPESTFIEWYEKVFLTVLLVIFGMVGNLLSFALLSRPRFRDSAAGFYMRALSVSDAGVMFGLVGNHTMRLYRVPLHSDIYCKTIYFAIKWLMAASDWILGAMCLERSIAVSFPLKSKGYLKPRNNRVALGIILVMLAVYFGYAFDAYGSRQGLCRTVSMAYPVNIRTMVDYSLFLVPAILVISSNFVIIVSTVKSARHQLTLTESTDTSYSSSTQRSLVAMLVTISVAFVVLKSPYYLAKVILPASLSRNIGYLYATRKEALNRLVFGFFFVNMYVNNAVNFYLYALSGRAYRKELKMMFTSFCRRQTENNTE